MKTRPPKPTPLPRPPTPRPPTPPSPPTIPTPAKRRPYSSSYASPPAAHADLDLATPRPSHATGTTTPSPSFADSADLTLTPRPARAPRPKRTPPDASSNTTVTTAPYDSPYERLRREVLPHSSETSPSQPESPSLLPSTPRTHPSRAEPPPSASAAPDTLLHRVLDRTYRLKATPHAAPRTGIRRGGGVGGTPVTGRRAAAGGVDLDSSPLAEAPQLRSELFASPARTRAREAGARRDEAERVPGTSVLTPAKKGGAPLFAKWEDDDEDEDEDEGLPAGMSPPKTMQFHIPQSQLLKTPGECRVFVGRPVETFGLMSGQRERRAVGLWRTCCARRVGRWRARTMEGEARKRRWIVRALSGGGACWKKIRSE